jgi:hypothetical protein
MKITGNEPAFPFWTYNEAGYGDAVVMRDMDGNQTINDYEPGLTIRQYFAAKAMQGYIASFTGDNIGKSDDVARRSVDYADELIRQLNEKLNPNG